jgi:hypothetical protein
MSTAHQHIVTVQSIERMVFLPVSHIDGRSVRSAHGMVSVDEHSVRSDDVMVNIDDRSVQSTHGMVNVDDRSVRSDDGMVNVDDCSVRSAHGMVNVDEPLVSAPIFRKIRIQYRHRPRAPDRTHHLCLTTYALHLKTQI